eukprot:CAMPEP_0114560346 /NCGR_PEP_ID=MMETSP0114-20121206/11412_1 /TAXON_ID=31324 /ORGANISM="Goniomonas sp, Strain m" /LENGTH=328 /DNA_ID=CAMNT_0001745889 /DNA_START=55 /DNA_END=1043 /DNA_ORIENTATION=-
MVGRWQQPATSKKPQHDESGVMQGRHGEDGVHIGVQQEAAMLGTDGNGPIVRKDARSRTGQAMIERNQGYWKQDGFSTGERNQEAAMLGTDGNGPIVRKDARSRTGQAMIERNQGYWKQDGFSNRRTESGSCDVGDRWERPDRAQGRTKQDWAGNDRTEPGGWNQQQWGDDNITWHPRGGWASSGGSICGAGRSEWQPTPGRSGAKGAAASGWSSQGDWSEAGVRSSWAEEKGDLSDADRWAEGGWSDPTSSWEPKRAWSGAKDGGWAGENDGEAARNSGCPSWPAASEIAAVKSEPNSKEEDCPICMAAPQNAIASLVVTALVVKSV